MKRLLIVLLTVASVGTCAGPATAQFFDNFDAYTAGTNVIGNNGWQGWDNVAAAGANVSNAQANSLPNSIAVTGPSDLVNTLGNPTSGSWILTADQYIPSGFVGAGSGAAQGSFFIVLNTYNANGPYDWSVELAFRTNGNIVDSYGAPAGQVVGQWIPNQWVPIRIEIDLDNDTVSQYYNGGLLGPANQVWANRPGAGAPAGVTSIGAIDLYANNSSVVYYDNVALTRVPEPATGLLGLFGLLAAGWLRRR